ncbi:hypothetical protein ACHAW6_001954 [Cyclotella cf. meneghiniana]
MIRTRALSFIRHSTTLNRRNLQPKSPLVPSSCSSSLPIPSLPWRNRPWWSPSISPSTTTIRRPSSNSKDAHQEAIEKAQRLHAELNEMIAAQRAAQKALSEKPYSSSLKEFLTSAKPQLINIFFAFVCVLLAFQIHGLRGGYKKLLADAEEKNDEVERLRSILRKMCDIPAAHDEVDDDDDERAPPSFSLALSEKCTDAVRSIFARSDAKPGYAWIAARKLAAADPAESARFADALRRVIVREMREAAGDAVWNEEEKKERRVVELQAGVDEDVGYGGGGVEAQMSGLVEVLQQVHEEDLVDGKILNEDEGAIVERGKVKRMRYAI